MAVKIFQAFVFLDIHIHGFENSRVTVLGLRFMQTLIYFYQSVYDFS